MSHQDLERLAVCQMLEVQPKLSLVTVSAEQQGARENSPPRTKEERPRAEHQAPHLTLAAVTYYANL